MRFSFLLIPALLISSISWGQEYAVMIDAGSTGSRIYLYEITRSNTIRLLEKHRIEPGLSSFSSNPEGVAVYLEPLMQFAKEKLVSLAEPSQVPITLQATGGVRALSAADQQKVIQSAQQALAKSGFANPLAEVITGEQEGIYQWTSINYLRKTLDPNRKNKKLKTAGLVEMGGASLQVTFLKKESVEAGLLGPQLYSVSYDGFGESSAWKSLGEKHCKEIPLDYTKCRRFVASKLQEIHQPKLQGEFYLVDNFEQLASLLKLKTISSRKLDRLGPGVCKKSLDTLKTELPRESDYYLSKICFDIAYMSVVLEKIGFQRNRELIAAKDIEDTTLTWTLGSLYDHAIAKKLKSE